MKTVVVFSTLVAMTLAAVPNRHQTFLHSTAPVRQVAAPAQFAPVQVQQRYSTDTGVVLLKETLSNNIGLDNYQFGYELSDGTARDEAGQIELRGPEDGTLRVRGSYRFVGTDGQTYTVTYVADENGFQPQGAHLPVRANQL